MADLYGTLLGDAWVRGPEVLRQVHSEGRSRGEAWVERGTHVLCPLLAWLAGLPPDADRLPIELTIEQRGGWSTWHRRMGQTTFVTRQTVRDGLLVERYRLFELSFKLSFDGTTLVFQQVAAALVLGRLGVRLPKWLSPRVAATAIATKNSVVFLVEVAAPMVGTVVLYQGSVVPESHT